MTTDKRLIKHKGQTDKAADVNKSRPTLPKTALSLKMGPPVIEANADGHPEMVAIVDGWEPVFRIAIVDQVEDRGWN